MTLDEAYCLLTTLVRLLVGQPALVITEATLGTAIDGWDSLQQVLLFAELEERLGVRFSSSEIDSITSFRELAELLARKTAHSAV